MPERAGPVGRPDRAGESRRVGGAERGKGLRSGSVRRSGSRRRADGRDADVKTWGSNMTTPRFVFPATGRMGVPFAQTGGLAGKLCLLTRRMGFGGPPEPWNYQKRSEPLTN